MYKKLCFIVILMTILIQTQLATADFSITNDSATERAWITYSTWRQADENWPAGYRTKGWIEIQPGGSVNIEIPASNLWLYLRVEREGDTEIKPPDYFKRKSFPFWLHPNQAFAIVEAEDGDILKKNVSTEGLINVPLYEFQNGGEYTIPAEHDTIVRVIYFLPNDLNPLHDIDEKIDRLIKATQQLFATEMDRHGYDEKTIIFETDEDGQHVIHWFSGLYADTYYHTDTSDKILNELVEEFDLTQDLYLIFTDVTSEGLESGLACGEGQNPDAFTFGYYEHWAIVPAFGDCLTEGKALPLIAHELGHAFGLRHDMRNDNFIMSYGDKPTLLSKCAAGWLDASKYFNTQSVFSDKPTTIYDPLLSKSPPNAISIDFQVEDFDGLHQARLVIPRTGDDTSGYESLFGCESLDGATEATVEFVVPITRLITEDPITFQTIDQLGNIELLEYEPPLDAIKRALEDSPAAPKLPEPIETALLFNYPNPFNPETWIPYQLAKPADVTLSIYAVNGQIVRRLALGHQLAGVYQSNSRAAYWDGRNEVGEPVASGLYFYTITAGDFTATRKMLIRK